MRRPPEARTVGGSHLRTILAHMPRRGRSSARRRPAESISSSATPPPTSAGRHGSRGSWRPPATGRCSRRGTCRPARTSSTSWTAACASAAVIVAVLSRNYLRSRPRDRWSGRRRCGATPASWSPSGSRTARSTGCSRRSPTGPQSSVGDARQAATVCSTPAPRCWPAGPSRSVARAAFHRAAAGGVAPSPVPRRRAAPATRETVTHQPRPDRPLPATRRRPRPRAARQRRPCCTSRVHGSAEGSPTRTSRSIARGAAGHASGPTSRRLADAGVSHARPDRGQRRPHRVGTAAPSSIEALTFLTGLRVLLGLESRPAGRGARRPATCPGRRAGPTSHACEASDVQPAGAVLPEAGALRRAVRRALPGPRRPGVRRRAAVDAVRRSGAAGRGRRAQLDDGDDPPAGGRLRLDRQAQAAWFAERLRPFEQSGWLRLGVVRHDPPPGGVRSPSIRRAARRRHAGRAAGAPAQPAAARPGPGGTAADCLGLRLPVLCAAGARSGRDRPI